MTESALIKMRYALERSGFELAVDVELPLRGITGVFGASGAGKTSLLRCIAGLEHVRDGFLAVAGQVWEGEGTSLPTYRRPIGYVFQEPRLFDHLSVAGNIDYGRRRRYSGLSRDTDDVTELLGLGQLLERKPAALSGGEAQRVAIARALLCAPQVVLMDEPLASLDQPRRDEILPYLDRLHREARTPVIYVSHNIDEICRLCDQLLVLDHGRVLAYGPLQEVLVRTDVPVLSGEEACTVIGGQVNGFDSDDRLLRLEVAAGQLWVPGAFREPGTPVRLRIRANDVSLCRQRPQQTTILNVVPAVIEAIGEGATASAIVRLAAGNDRILARVTQRSIRELRLRQGDEVFAQIKSVAVRQS